MREGLFAYLTCKFVLLFDVFYILARGIGVSNLHVFLEVEAGRDYLVAYDALILLGLLWDRGWILNFDFLLNNGGNRNRRGNLSFFLFLNRKFLRDRGCCCLRHRYLYRDLLRLG
jgi:hypothetical protein